MEKTFVLRLQVSSSSDEITMHFDKDNEVVVPMAVYERLKSSYVPENRKRIAAHVANYLSSLPSADLCNPDKGVIQKNGSRVFVLDHQNEIDQKIKQLRGLTEYDMRIFQLCLELKEKGKEVHLISKNPVIRTKSGLLGIIAEPFRDELAPSLSEQYSGKGGKVIVSQNSFEKMFSGREGIEIGEILEQPETDFVENMFFQVASEQTPSNYILGRYTDKRIVPFQYAIHNMLPRGLQPKNDDQKIMLECLLAPPDVAPMVVIKGPAGSGKTYVTICCAINALHNKKNNSPFGSVQGLYEQIVMAAPMIDMEKIGALPGEKEEKMAPYLQGLRDNIRKYFSCLNGDKDLVEIYTMVNNIFNSRFIDLVPATYMRGRSFDKTFVINDESQNYKPDLILDITTRGAGQSKVVFLGDPTQTNNPECNSRFNGVTYASESMKGSPVCWQLTLTEVVRSRLAEEAVKRMKK